MLFMEGMFWTLLVGAPLALPVTWLLGLAPRATPPPQPPGPRFETHRQ
jgi:hypothetical protein